MNLEVNAETISRRYYWNLKALIAQAELECLQYEKGKPMRARNVITAAVTAIESGSRAELIETLKDAGQPGH